MLVWLLASWLRWQGMICLHLWSLTLETPGIKDSVPEIAASASGIKYLAVCSPSLLSFLRFTAVILAPTGTGESYRVMLASKRLAVSHSTRQQKVCQEAKEQRRSQRTSVELTPLDAFPPGGGGNGERHHREFWPWFGSVRQSSTTDGPVTRFSRLLQTRYVAIYFFVHYNKTLSKFVFGSDRRFF